jgi:hypothetical protein
MKPALGFLVGLTMLPYAGAFFPGPGGNPDREPYAGESGGVYDSAANPPRTDGVVTYDPNAPLPKPADASAQGNSGMPAPPRTP